LSDDQTLYRLISIRGNVQKFEFAEDAARPVFHDRKAKTIRLQLSGKPDADALAKLIGAGPATDQRIDAAELKLPGVTLKGIKGTMHLEGKCISIALSE